MIEKILAKHPPEDFPRSQKARVEAAAETYQQLRDKWAHRVPPSWYGFALDGAPVRWLHIIDEFLDYIAEHDPNLEIHQIKLKFGGLRFYVDCDPRFREEIATLEEHLYDSQLIH